ncbi:RNase [Colletotrichum kahawae]|uniref:RNase n=1 Tax=Colletotrichum kahawae TaxID=34407 RepID=A0AAE0CZV9_COLKA|nr:RNase [Colletotrichum kahawae]
MSDAEEILGYDFKDPRWLWEALQTAGSPVTRVGTRSLREGNKQLAGLGDRIMSVVIVTMAVDDNISIAGDTNARLQSYANNERLARLCDTVGLTRCIVRNPSQQGMVSQRTKADILEAVIGAVFKDGGLEAAEEVIEHLNIIDLPVTFQTPSKPHTGSVIKMTLNSALFGQLPGSLAWLRLKSREGVYIWSRGKQPCYSTNLVGGALLSI